MQQGCYNYWFTAGTLCSVLLRYLHPSDRLFQQDQWIRWEYVAIGRRAPLLSTVLPAELISSCDSVAKFQLPIFQKSLQTPKDPVKRTHTHTQTQKKVISVIIGSHSHKRCHYFYHHRGQRKQRYIIICVKANVLRQFHHQTFSFLVVRRDSCSCPHACKHGIRMLLAAEIIKTLCFLLKKIELWGAKLDFSVQIERSAPLLNTS